MATGTISHTPASGKCIIERVRERERERERERNGRLLFGKGTLREERARDRPTDRVHHGWVFTLVSFNENDMLSLMEFLSNMATAHRLSRSRKASGLQLYGHLEDGQRQIMTKLCTTLHTQALPRISHVQSESELQLPLGPLENCK